MSTLLPFIVAGVATGSVYALAGMGLVVTYKTSGVFNFAHGALGTVAAYLFFELHTNQGVPWPVAALISIAAVGVLGGIGLERLARRLMEVSTALKVVATVGLLVAIQGLAVVLYGSAARNVPAFLPTGTFTVAGVNVGYDQLILFVLAALSAVGLSLFFKRSRLGIAMRGVVDDPSLVALAATSPVKVRSRAWVIGCTFAAASGVLLVPSIGLDSILLTLLVVQAFGAAAVGAFSSLPLTYAGGLVVGIGQALATKYVGSHPSLGGLPPSFPFIVLFVTLLVMPKRRLMQAPARRRLVGAAQPQRRGGSSVVGYGALAAVLLAAPVLAGPRVPLFTTGMIFVIVFASLQLLVRTSGQVSLCHAAFVAVGASTFANLTGGPHMPWLLALLAAGLVTVPVGALVAVPAIRLSGIYLAVATFGFGVLVERVAYQTSLMFGQLGSRSAPRPHLLGIDLTGDRAFYYVVLGVVVAALALMVLVQRTRLGRLLRGLAGSPTALETYGASVNTTRVLVFCISAFLAGIAGALFAAASGSVNGTSFNSLNSLLWLAVLMLAGSMPVMSSFVAGLFLVVVPGYIHDATVLSYQPVLFGLAAIGVAVAAAGGFRLPAGSRSLATRSVDRSRRSPVASRRAAIRAPTRRAAIPAQVPR
jgi:branched-subunit amino acid ABC-type transport system permease component